MDPVELEVEDFPASAFVPDEPVDTQEEENPNKDSTPEPEPPPSQGEEENLDLASVHSQDDDKETGEPPGVDGIPNKDPPPLPDPPDPPDTPPVAQSSSEPKPGARATKSPSDPDPSYHPIIEITDYVMGPGGDQRVRIKFKDQDELWLPVTALNETAKKKFLEDHPKPRSIPRLLRGMD